MTTDQTAATTRQSWQLDVDADRVAWLTFDKPDSSANSLSRQSMLDLDARLGEIERLKPRAVVVQSGKKSGFIAGADIKEFTSLTSGRGSRSSIDWKSYPAPLSRPLTVLRWAGGSSFRSPVTTGWLQTTRRCRSRFPKFSSASTRVSGAPSVLCGCSVPSWRWT